MSQASRSGENAGRISAASRAFSRFAGAGVIVAAHAAALASLYQTEYGLFAMAVFLLTWGVLNCFFLVMARRPAVAALASLAMIELLIVVSKFKFDITWMTINFLDILMIDPDSMAFLLGVMPDLRITVLAAVLAGALLLALVWRLDPMRVRRRTASLGGAACLAGAVTLSAAVPEQPWEPFQGVNHVSSFVRSGTVSLTEFVLSGVFDADREAAERLKMPAEESCQAKAKRPHIVMVLDESSFDARAIPGVKLVPDYARHFLSYDGKERALLVETTGGSTWLAEYGALTGLSARSFGRLKFYVTRIAAGRVERGLPNALRRCGYRTFTLYPAYGSFLSARSFQKTVGVERFMDTADMRAGDVEPDRFFYDRALKTIAEARGANPLFLFVYTVANHFPWDVRYMPELTPGWRDPGNGTVLDEYLRRQKASAADYADFVARLKKRFPEESFLIVRFGDHGPNFAPRLLDPQLPDGEIAQRIQAYHPRYFTTYYVIDGVNFTPSDVSSALDAVEVAYLPLIVQEAAGLPLDPSFEEQKRILQRCQGLFYRCAAGAEARRFNRLLIDAGLIKGL